jgi:hypothetical protein
MSGSAHSKGQREGNREAWRRGEDFAEDVVYVRDGVELAGKGSELGGWLLGFEKLLLFTGMEDTG